MIRSVLFVMVTLYVLGPVAAGVAWQRLPDGRIKWTIIGAAIVGAFFAHYVVSFLTGDEALAMRVFLAGLGIAPALAFCSSISAKREPLQLSDP